MSFTQFFNWVEGLFTRLLNKVEEWGAFLFDFPLSSRAQPAIRTIRETGFGISAPNAYRFRDVIRHDPAMVLALFSLLTLISRGLYIIISPQDIFDIRYILANLYILYTIGTIVLIYQAIRDMGNVGPIDGDLPERFPPLVRCSICLLDQPLHELISLQCNPDAEEEAHPERPLHAFHEHCLRETFREQAEQERPLTCPLCRRLPLSYQRGYGPPRHGILDNSRLMWYINSLFSRRLPLAIDNWRWRLIVPSPSLPTDSFDRHYLQILLKVLPLHMIFMTLILFIIRFIYLTLLLPLSWVTWAVVVGVTGLFLNSISDQAVQQLFAIAALFPFAFSLGLFLDVISRTCNFFFPRYSPANPAHRPRPRNTFQFLRRLLWIQLNYFWMLVWHMIFKTIFLATIRPWKIYLIVIFSVGIYHYVTILISPP